LSAPVHLRTARCGVSQSLTQSYGSIWPTSLIYVPLHNHGLFTLETCCGVGYGRRDASARAAIFTNCACGSGPLAGSRSARGACVSPAKPFPRTPRASKRKENSSQAHAQRTFASAAVSPRSPRPATRSRKLARVPFRPKHLRARA